MRDVSKLVRRTIVPRQSERYAQDLIVELYANGNWRRTALQDISRTGMFLATNDAVAANATVIVAFTTDDGARVSSLARVTHALAADDAEVLGRARGLGIEFRDPQDAAFSEAVEAILRRARTRQPEHSHIVVGAAEPRLLERLSTALGAAGFSVSVATNGLEVWGACMRRTPDLVLVDFDLPMLDGPSIVEKLACDDALASVPAILMAGDANMLGPALARGAADVILKPFTLLELIARTRRVALQPKRTERVSLSGSLTDVGLGVLLTLIEQQRKSSRIVLSNGDAAWLDVVDGRIVDAGWSRGVAHARTIVMELLDWERGSFKLVPSPARSRSSDLVLPVTHLLLEHARLRDEQRSKAIG
jgi:CheY-like chemotaxis protein